MRMKPASRVSVVGKGASSKGRQASGSAESDEGCLSLWIRAGCLETEDPVMKDREKGRVVINVSVERGIKPQPGLYRRGANGSGQGARRG